MNFDKKEFPFFTAHPKLIYLDNAATSHKPASVIQAMSDFYAHDNASAWRGLYKTAEAATQKCEDVRALCADFIGAQPSEIAFTGGATDGINTVARAWAAHVLQPGDEILISELEHHANILVWQQLAQQKGLVLRWIKIDFNGVIQDQSQGQAGLDALINVRTKLVALTADSHVLGNVDALAQKKYDGGFVAHVIQKAHAVGARVLVDAAQLAPHARLSVKKLDCDFLVFSAHKMCGPQGIGALYVARDLHTSLQPYRLGGGMVARIDHVSATWQPFPHLLEAGTQPVASIVGFGAALEYLKNSDFALLQKHEAALCDYFLSEVRKNDAIQILAGGGEQKRPEHLVSFVFDGMHAHDVAAYLDARDICVRAGTHCAQILHKKLGVAGSVRVSFYGYNTQRDVERVVHALAELKEISFAI